MSENKRMRYVPKAQAGGQLADAMPAREETVKNHHGLIAFFLLIGLVLVLASLLFVGLPLYYAGLVFIAAGHVRVLLNLYFAPIPVVLENGHKVMRRRSPVFIALLVFVPCFVYAIRLTGFDLSLIFSRIRQFTVILKKIFSPDFSYIGKVVAPLVDTIKMSVIGSFIGCTLALPFAVVASSNINHNKYVVSFLRILLNIVRTLPTLVLASICALIFSFGTFAGTVAITVFTFGIVSKMLYEAIETIDMGAFEAMESMGSSKPKAFVAAVMPQILPTYLSQCLYSFEINVRAAAILGYVGAGGLGILMDERIGFRDYQGLGMVLLCLYVAVLFIDSLSSTLRSKLS